MESSFGTDIRNPWNLLGYSAVVFWYALPGANHNRPPQPAAAAQPILSIAQLQKLSDDIRYGKHSPARPGAVGIWGRRIRALLRVVLAIRSPKTRWAITNSPVWHPFLQRTVPPGAAFSR